MNRGQTARRRNQQKKGKGSNHSFERPKASIRSIRSSERKVNYNNEGNGQPARVNQSLRLKYRQRRQEVKGG
jgi:hypothetical protein